MKISLDGWRFSGFVIGVYPPDPDWQKYLQKPTIETVKIVFVNDDDIDVNRREMWARKASALRKNLFDAMDSGEVFQDMKVVSNGSSVHACNVVVTAIAKVRDNWMLTFRLLDSRCW